MTLPQPGTKGTITAGPSKGQHGTVIEPKGYWVRTDVPWQAIRLTARMMLDAAYRQPSWDAPAIIFQVKEHHGPAGDSDPRLWVAALPDAPLQRFALNGGFMAHWVNPFTIPRGEWFTLALEFRPGEGAKLLLNGAQVAAAGTADTVARYADARLTFGVGTYGQAQGAAWCDWATVEALT